MRPFWRAILALALAIATATCDTPEPEAQPGPMPSATSEAQPDAARTADDIALFTECARVDFWVGVDSPGSRETYEFDYRQLRELVEDRLTIAGINGTHLDLPLSPPQVHPVSPEYYEEGYLEMRGDGSFGFRTLEAVLDVPVEFSLFEDRVYRYGINFSKRLADPLTDETVLARTRSSELVRGIGALGYGGMTDALPQVSAALDEFILDYLRANEGYCD